MAAERPLGLRQRRTPTFKSNAEPINTCKPHAEPRTVKTARRIPLPAPLVFSLLPPIKVAMGAVRPCTGSAR